MQPEYQITPIVQKNFSKSFYSSVGSLFSPLPSKEFEIHLKHEFDMSFFHNDEDAIGSDWKTIGFEIGQSIDAYEKKNQNKKYAVG